MLWVHGVHRSGTAEGAQASAPQRHCLPHLAWHLPCDRVVVVEVERHIQPLSQEVSGLAKQVPAHGARRQQRLAQLTAGLACQQAGHPAAPPAPAHFTSPHPTHLSTTSCSYVSGSMQCTVLPAVHRADQRPGWAGGRGVPAAAGPHLSQNPVPPCAHCARPVLRTPPSVYRHWKVRPSSRTDSTCSSSGGQAPSASVCCDDTHTTECRPGRPQGHGLMRVRQASQQFNNNNNNKSQQLCPCPPCHTAETWRGVLPWSQCRAAAAQDRGGTWEQSGGQDMRLASSRGRPVFPPTPL